MHLIGLVREAVAQFGLDGVDWKGIGQMMNKTARQCRDRYKNYLSPGIVNGPWTAEEDILLRESVESLGCHWSVMMKYFPGRTDVNLKNRWSILKERNVETKKSVVSLTIQKLSMSETVHSFIGEKVEAEAINWLDILFTGACPSSFHADNCFEYLEQ